MKRIAIFSFIYLLVCSQSLWGQQSKPDTVTFNNGYKALGEILWMENNRLVIDVDYIHGNLEAKWNRIIRVDSYNSFQVNLSNAETYFGRLKTISDGVLVIVSENYDSVKCNITDIILLRPVKSRFIDKFFGSISIGFDLAKSRNLRTFTARSEIGYKTRKSNINLYYDALISAQDETDIIQRSDGSFGYYHQFPRHFYGFGLTSFLSNTQQRLDIRWGIMAGGGSNIIKNQKLSWVWGLGINHNLERFSSDTEDRQSWEGMFGTSLDIFNLGDLKLKTSILNFSSLTETNRWRTDIKFDVRYNIKYLKKTELTNKIFVKLGFSANFDNKPAEEATTIDYVLNTTLGFSWNE